MHPYDYVVILYGLCWLLRIWGCIRRGRQPLLRGPEWFFDVQVHPTFYDGPGRKILHRYWMRMFVPIVVELPLASAIFLSGKLWLLNWLMIVFSVAIIVNHSFSVDLAEREARTYAVHGSEQPATHIALSLTPRRLRDYTNWNLEVVFGASSVFALAWLVRYYISTAQQDSARLVFGPPALLLYLQAGMLFTKHIIVGWRSPLPETAASEYIDAREETRRFYLRVCDWGRAMFTAALLFYPIKLTASAANRIPIVTTWMAAMVIATAVSAVWMEMGRRQVLLRALHFPPLIVPDFLGQSDIRRALLCYEPSAPMLMLKGRHGYSLNLANRLAYVAGVYLAGLILLLGTMALSLPH